MSEGGEARCSRCGHLVQSHALRGKGPCMVGCGCRGAEGGETRNPSEVGSLSLRPNFQARDLNRSPQDEDHEAALREKNKLIADLARSRPYDFPGPPDLPPVPDPQGEDHETGMRAATEAISYALRPRAADVPVFDPVRAREAAEAGIAAYLSRCPSPEHNERVSQDHDPGRDD